MGGSAFKSLGVVVALVLWSAAPVVQALHGSHSHRYCAEHQAIEEASAEGTSNVRGEGAHLDLSKSEVAEVGVSASAVDLLGGEHQICPVCSTSRAGGCPIRSSLLALAIHWKPTTEPSDRKLTLRPIPPLTSAPKNSPPA